MLVEVKLLESVKEMMRNILAADLVSGNTNVYNILKKKFHFFREIWIQNFIFLMKVF